MVFIVEWVVFEPLEVDGVMVSNDDIIESLKGVVAGYGCLTKVISVT
jgi:hypothetical protein